MYILPWLCMWLINLNERGNLQQWIWRYNEFCVYAFFSLCVHAWSSTQQCKGTVYQWSCIINLQQFQHVKTNTWPPPTVVTWQPHEIDHLHQHSYLSGVFILFVYIHIYIICRWSTVAEASTMTLISMSKCNSVLLNISCGYHPYAYGFLTWYNIAGMTIRQHWHSCSRG